MRHEKTSYKFISQLSGKGGKEKITFIDLNKYNKFVYPVFIAIVWIWEMHLFL